MSAGFRRHLFTRYNSLLLYLNSVVTLLLPGIFESDVQKIAQLLSESSAFYDAEMIAQITNAMLRSYHHQQTINDNNKKPTIDSVTPSEVNYVMRQLKTAGIPIP
jgi:hypothetical protein